jgi:hypothetical protein
VEVNDVVYGKYKVREQILIDLIKTKAIQRLKKIRQQGLPKEWHYGFEFTRYDHSIGVMILLDKFNAPLKERIAGLLHDVSHMAFSHVYDYLINNHDESHGDDVFFNFINEDEEIKQVLKKHGYEIDDISDFGEFKLLERSAPDLCADRVDYTLREYVGFKNDNLFTNRLLGDMIVHNNEIIFKTKKSARNFYNTYKYFAENHWGGIKHTMNYNLFVEVLKQALKLKLIKENDFKKTDDYIIRILKQSKDKIIKENIRKLETKDFEVPENYDGFIGKKRFVNPKYTQGNKLLYLLDTKTKRNEKTCSQKKKTQS